MVLTVFLPNYWNYLKIDFPANSFSSGVFTSTQKTPKVIPVLKINSKLDFSNYIPVSLLSNIEKVWERLMYNRSCRCLSDNNFNYSLQFGFRQKYAKVHALISLTENIRKNLHDWNIVCGIFVDS